MWWWWEYLANNVGFNIRDSGRDRVDKLMTIVSVLALCWFRHGNGGGDSGVVGVVVVVVVVFPLLIILIVTIVITLLRRQLNSIEM